MGTPKFPLRFTGGPVIGPNIFKVSQEKWQPSVTRRTALVRKRAPVRSSQGRQQNWSAAGARASRGLSKLFPIRVRLPAGKLCFGLFPAAHLSRSSPFTRAAVLAAAYQWERGFTYQRGAPFAQSEIHGRRPSPFWNGSLTSLQRWST